MEPTGVNYMSFNPCKGFGVIGAAWIMDIEIKQKGFNPCKGFGVIGAKEAA